MIEKVYLQIDGVKGGSTDHQHPGWTVVELAQIIGGQVLQSRSASGGASSGKAGPIEGLRFSLNVSNGAPVQEAPGALLVAYQQGYKFRQIIAESWWGSKLVYRLTMKGVFITSLLANNGFSCYFQFSTYELQRGKI